MSQKTKARHIVVIGGGHAGCEAALAAARMGQRVTLFALNLDSLALMPCNPCIGGSAKGHLVREIDALGGQMGRAIDATFIQSRMLNASKGPAVYSLRAQADKRRYMTYMKQVLEAEPNILLREAEVVDILTDASSDASSDAWQNCAVQSIDDAASSGVQGGKASQKVVGVVTETGAKVFANAVIVCTGTYLNARCLYGETINHNGPNGQRASVKLSGALTRLGFFLQRFKTGTPARVHRRSIDFSKMAVQPGDERLVPFSFESDPGLLMRAQVPCHLTYTNNETHEIIRGALHRSSMYSGLIDATGTRYCPSIEDKIVRFADKDRHQVFIEPEGLDTEEMYVQGMSSALPEEVQVEVYRSIAGLENCEIMRPAYAIEYDCIDATMLNLQLEAKHVGGLYFAGQINGSSGYEEAAAQGLVAGVNAAGLGTMDSFHIDRAEGYIGVLIDDLVTKGTNEPYRMMTSRAEYRLLLRQDNADLRLTEKGYRAGLISENRYRMFVRKKDAITAEIARLSKVNLAPDAVNGLLAQRGSSLLATGAKITDLIKRPELSYWDLVPLVGGTGISLSCATVPSGEALPSSDVVPSGGTLPSGDVVPSDEALPSGDTVPLGEALSSSFFLPRYVQDAIDEQVNIQIKYEGYISMQMTQAAAFRKMEHKALPPDIDYEAIKGLRIEARQKLSRLRPVNLGQASRITGVSPADMSILLVYLKAFT